MDTWPYISVYSVNVRLKLKIIIQDILDSSSSCFPPLLHAICLDRVEDVPNDHGTDIRWLLRTCCTRMKKLSFFPENSLRFVASLDLIKCPKQIK